MVLLIDNYDSFTYNLYQYIGKYDSDIRVVRNDKITLEEIEKLNPDQIIISPGPKAPKDAGISLDVIKSFYNKKPILGICLGHQSIGEAFGGEIVYAKKLYHGKTSKIEHSGTKIFHGISQKTEVARYHSLAIETSTLSEEFEILALTEDNEIMAIAHRKYPVIGVQFHPESICTVEGEKMIENFFKIVGA